MTDWMQTLVVAVLVLAAVAFVARRAWRTLRPARAGAGCDSGCGCGDAKGSTSSDWAST